MNYSGDSASTAHTNQAYSQNLFQTQYNPRQRIFATIRDDEEESVLADFIEDEDTVSPEESATGQLLKEQVKEMLSALTEREQKILKLRFGLEDGKSHTLEEVGQEFSVTRERIRQIEAKALAKLRKHRDAKKLHDYIK